MKVAMIMTSSSRPDLLEQTLDDLLDSEKLSYSGNIDLFFHEDFINYWKSNDCVSIIKEFPWLKHHTEHYPPIGQGPAVDLLLFRTKHYDYILKWEDDWKIRKKIDLDRLLRIMEENKDKINQISFQKRHIMPEKPGFKKKEIKIDGQNFTTNPHWAFIPSLWRRSFVDKWWKALNRGSGAVWEANRNMKRVYYKIPDKVYPDSDWVINNSKTFYLGSIGDGWYMEHLATNYSARLGEVK